MSNANQFIPPAAAASLAKGDAVDNETDLPNDDPTLDEGETNDSQAEVERDIEESADSSDKLDK